MEGLNYRCRSDCSLPFTFSQATCSHNFDRKALKAFLMQRGLYGKGLWKHVCSKTMSKGLKFGTMHEDRLPFVLRKESAILQSPIVNCPYLDRPLENWLQYYTLRGFEMDSPIAGLLHYPLTLYWITTNSLAKMYPDLFERVKQSGNLHVHVVGAEKEADLFLAFMECAHLLAPIKLHMHLFGDEICKEMDGHRQNQDNLTFHLHSGLYHECHLKQLPTPDIIVGFNAGLGAYLSFKKTLELILATKLPLFCTDYCHESVIHSEQALGKLRLGKVNEVKRNPFHSPFRISSPELENPCFSNAFVFSVHNYNDT